MFEKIKNLFYVKEHFKLRNNFEQIRTKIY